MRLSPARLSVGSFLKVVVLIIPIVLFYLPILLTGDKLHFGDFDMQVQMTEAARKVITEYHQFPFWNPWISGGVPLFADPQFGLFSPQTLLSFFIGSVVAWKITLILYLTVGFFSMKKLLDYLVGKASNANILISYVWIFSSFFVLRATGHFTFLFLALLPLAILLALKSKASNKHLVALALLFTYCLYAAIHYSTILIVLCVLFVTVSAPLVSLFLEGKNRKINLSDVLSALKQPVLRILLALTAALILAGPRIYLSLEYLHDNGANRTAVYEKFVGLPNGLRALACPYQASWCVDVPRFAQETTWGFFEASSYVGISTLVLFVSLIGVIFTRKKKTKPGSSSAIIVSLSSLALLSFVLGLGGILYSAFRLLPLMSSMRVSTRWFFITMFCLLILTALLYANTAYSKAVGSKTKKVLAALLFISLIEVVLVNYPLNKSFWVSENMYSLEKNNTHQKVIKQERLWEAPDALRTRYYALTEATSNNRGQIIADNALVDTSILPSLRCDQDESGCSFVKSNNATVLSWTPHKIVLQRTGPGLVELNMNPGSHWRVNGTYPFLDKKVVDASEKFLIDVTSQKIVVEYQPVPSLFK